MWHAIKVHAYTVKQDRAYHDRALLPALLAGVVTLPVCSCPLFGVRGRWPERLRRDARSSFFFFFKLRVGCTWLPGIWQGHAFVCMRVGRSIDIGGLVGLRKFLGAWVWAGWFWVFKHPNLGVG